MKNYILCLLQTTLNQTILCGIHVIMKRDLSRDKKEFLNAHKSCVQGLKVKIGRLV